MVCTISRSSWTLAAIDSSRTSTNSANPTRFRGGATDVPAALELSGETPPRHQDLRCHAGADWVLITNADGVLKAWTARRNVFDQDFARGALIGRALEAQTTE